MVMKTGAAFGNLSDEIVPAAENPRSAPESDGPVDEFEHEQRQFDGYINRQQRLGQQLFGLRGRIGRRRRNGRQRNERRSFELGNGQRASLNNQTLNCIINDDYIQFQPKL